MRTLFFYLHVFGHALVNIKVMSSVLETNWLGFNSFTIILMSRVPVQLKTYLHQSEAATDVHLYWLAASCCAILTALRLFSQIEHVLVRGFRNRPSDNVPTVTGCSIGIKEVINQLTGLQGQCCSLRGNSAATHHTGCWLGHHSTASTCSYWQHEAKTTTHMWMKRLHAVWSGAGVSC